MELGDFNETRPGNWSGPQSVELFSELEPIALEFGGHLGPVRVAYETWGRLNDRGDNAILICHALTRNTHVLGSVGWWMGMAGLGRAIDPQRHFIVCSNIRGSCYGTTGPASPAPGSGNPWRMKFPAISVRDIVRLQHEWVVRLGIRRLRMVIGGPLFKVESYLRYQGQKLRGRFDAACYYRLTQALDSHDLGRGRGPLAEVLGAIGIPILVIGIRSDILYPIAEQQEIVASVPRACYAEIDSDDGYDAFLIEYGQLNKYLADFFLEIGSWSVNIDQTAG